MNLKVMKLSKDLTPDFYSVNCDENGLGWCNCVAWWCTWKEFEDRTAEQNKAQREELFKNGEYDGYILYENDAPIGWSQCGPVGRLKKLCETYKLDSNSPAWAITCFALAPSARKRGLSKSFLRLIVDDLKNQGIMRVQGFPVRETKDPWTGPESSFQSAGFVLERDDKSFPIYGIKL